MSNHSHGLDTKIWKRLIHKTEMRSLMAEHDTAGMATMLYHSESGEGVTTVPTFGFNDETAEYKNLRHHRVGHERPGRDASSEAILLRDAVCTFETETNSLSCRVQSCESLTFLMPFARGVVSVFLVVDSGTSVISTRVAVRASCGCAGALISSHRDKQSPS